MMTQSAVNALSPMAPRRTNIRQLLIGLRVEVQALRRAMPAPALERIWETLGRLAEELDQSSAGWDSGPLPRRAIDDASPRVSVGPQAFWFRVADGPTTNLRRRRALRRILVALAARPRIPISSAVLMEAGWTGERALPHAASARIRSAIATLRRLGLRDVLVTTGDGYMLDADVVQVER